MSEQTNQNEVTKALKAIKEKTYNKTAAESARLEVEKNRESNPSFDKDSYRAFITDHPLFSKFHLISDTED